MRDGARDFELTAECHRAMTLAGSEYPGFGPFTPLCIAPPYRPSVSLENSALIDIMR